MIAETIMPAPEKKFSIAARSAAVITVISDTLAVVCMSLIL
jgi:hypothetical protein